MKIAEIVRKIYEGFGSGNVPAILEHISDEVDWEYAYEETRVPWLVPGTGRAHVAKFLQTVATSLEFRYFEVKHVLEGERLVVALCDLEATVRATGKKIVERHEPHLWHFDDHGVVIRFRHAADTRQHWEALRA